MPESDTPVDSTFAQLDALGERAQMVDYNESEESIEREFALLQEQAYTALDAILASLTEDDWNNFDAIMDEIVARFSDLDLNAEDAYREIAFALVRIRNR